MKELNIKGCWTFQPRVYSDNRGKFFEWYQDSSFFNQEQNHFNLAQSNCSISDKGVLRGIHFAKYPPGQAKYITCLSGSVYDVVVDLRKGSPTFGKWDSVLIDSRNPTAIFIPSGIGHAFMALEDQTIFVYLCDQRYNPDNELEISPFDKSIGIEWPIDVQPTLSPKDKNAPAFLELLDEYPNIEEFK